MLTIETVKEMLGEILVSLYERANEMKAISNSNAILLSILSPALMYPSSLATFVPVLSHSEHVRQPRLCTSCDYL